jgi:hypothetical protein
VGTQKRIIYATKGLAIKKSLSPAYGEHPGHSTYVGTAKASGVLICHPSMSGINPSGLWEVPRGVQSVGLTTTFNLEQVFQQGQLAIYENIEDRPDIEMTVSRILDGSHPLYLMASDDGYSIGDRGGGLTPKDSVANGVESAGHFAATSRALSVRNANYKVDLALQIYDEGVVTRAEAAAEQEVLASGMFLSSVSYTFPVDGNATEEITFVGNNKAWSVNNLIEENFFPEFTAPCENVAQGSTEGLILSDETAADTAASGITRREDVLLDGFTYTHNPFSDDLTPSTADNSSVIPDDIQTDDRLSIQNITISADLGRDEIFSLGQKDVYHRVIAFPLEVTCSIEVVTKAGDQIDAMADRDNLENKSIIIRTTHGLEIDLGDKNKLSSIDFTGGDTGGGEVTLTYNYSNFNVLNVRHLKWL